MAKAAKKKAPAAEPVVFEVEIWPIERIKPYDNNPKKHTDKGLAKLSAAIKEFGFQSAITVDRDGIIISGHGRLLAAKRLGMTELPVHVAADLSPEQCKALRLADNRLAVDEEINNEILKFELLDLHELDFDLSLTAFEPDELSSVMYGFGDGEPEAEAEGDGAVEQKKLTLTAEQYHEVMKAVEKLRRDESDENISDGRALELICTEWSQ